MGNNEIYPKGTVNQTEEFALRQKVKKIVGENIEEIIKQETTEAFKKLGYEENDGYMFVIAAGGKDNKEKEIGKGAKEGKLNVTVSVPKMLNMGAIKPVSYMQKVSTFGGKKIVSEIYLEIIGKTIHVDYKNTEASAFHQSSNKNTYAPGQLSKSGIITGIENETSFKKDFKKFFKPIAEAEVEYLIDTKIGNGDKSEKNMNDSIIKENKYSMKLTDLFFSTFEDAENKIDSLMNESFEIKSKESVAGTPNTSSGEPTDKKLVIGNEGKVDEENEESLEEITSSGTGGAGAYLTPHAFTNDGKTKAFKANKDYTQVQMNEDIKNTTYGMMRTQRAHLTRQNDGSYKIISENSSFPFTEKIEMEPGYLNVPKDMTKNYTMGRPGEPNSKEELANTGHGDLDKIQKQGKKGNQDENLNEDYEMALNLSKRKFSSLAENKEKGINKRYIITEKLSKENQIKRWKQLYENDCFCNVKDQTDTITRDNYEDAVNKEFEANNPPLESKLDNTQFSGEEEGFLDIPKAKGSMIVFRLSESDIKKNRIYLVDHFTNKLVYNPLYKPE